MHTTPKDLLFFSFADADKVWVDRLRRQLAPFEAPGTLRTWGRDQTPPGAEIGPETTRARARARAAVLLISADSLADPALSIERRLLVAAADRGELTLHLLLVRHCLYDVIPELSGRALLSRQPLTEMDDAQADRHLASLVRAVTGLGRVPDATPAAKHKAVVLTALPVEYGAVRAHLGDLRELVLSQGSIYEVGGFQGAKSWEVAIKEIGAGNHNAAFEAQLAIQNFSPTVAFFIGVAGGRRDVRIGDVVAATKVYGYEAGKEQGGFKPRPNVGESSFALVERARAEARKNDWRQRIAPSPQQAPQALLGAIAAGERVIAGQDEATALFLRENYGDALAVEMEGRGFLAAAHANASVAALVVRGISDLLDGKQKADEGGGQALAARHAAAFGFQILACL